MAVEWDEIGPQVWDNVLPADEPLAGSILLCHPITILTRGVSRHLKEQNEESRMRSRKGI